MFKPLSQKNYKMVFFPPRIVLANYEFSWYTVCTTQRHAQKEQKTMKKNGRLRSASASQLLFLSLIFSLAAIFLPLLLSSCQEEAPASFDGGSFLLRPEDMQGFTVVRSDSASDFVVRESLRICETISNATGKKVDLVTDWQREGATVPDSASPEQPLELLMGLTSREESQALRPELIGGDHYLIRTEGRSILIVSTSEALLADAVDKFLTDFVQIRGDQVWIASNIDYRSEDYPFFSIVRGGESRCSFVLPKNAGGRLVAAVNYIASRLEADYGCRVLVYGETDLDTLQGMIVVGTAESLSDRLSIPKIDPDTGLVEFTGEQLIITGDSNETVLAALSEFYAALQNDPDTDLAGYPYARFNTEKAITCTWARSDIPYLLGGVKQEEEAIATAETRITFGNVSEPILDHYAELLQSEGYSVTWRTVGENRSFFAENVFYRLQVNHTSASSTATVYVLVKR